MENSMRIGMLSREVIMLSRRVTVMIDDDLDKKLRKIQSRKIEATTASYSYSKTLNDVLRKVRM